MTETDFRRLVRGGSFPGEAEREPRHLLQSAGFAVAIIAIAGLVLWVPRLVPLW